jgi:UDP-glucose 4-epimerase
MSYLNQLKDRRVLITGASGFIGRHVVEMGQAAGVDIHTLSRHSIDKPGITSWTGNLTDDNRIAEIITNLRPDGILHLAAGGVAYGTGKAPDLLRVNTVGLAVLLETVTSLQLQPSIVIAGSGFEYAPQNRPLKETDPIAPPSAYGLSKAASTLLAQLYATQLPITILRLFSIYGLGEKEPRLTPYIIAQAQRGQPVEITPGEQLRDYTYVKDVAQAFWRALMIPPDNQQLRVLNVASGQAITLRDFIQAIANELSRHHITTDLRFGAKPYRPNELMNYTADISKLQDHLNWLPTTSLQQGLAEMVEEQL